MDATLCEEYEVPQSEVGLAVTCFCPICKAQVFGYLYCANIDDLVAHMSEMHGDRMPSRAKVIIV